MKCYVAAEDMLIVCQMLAERVNGGGNSAVQLRLRNNVAWKNSGKNNLKSMPQKGAGSKEYISVLAGTFMLLLSGCVTLVVIVCV